MFIMSVVTIAVHTYFHFILDGWNWCEILCPHCSMFCVLSSVNQGYESSCCLEPYGSFCTAHAYTHNADTHTHTHTHTHHAHTYTHAHTRTHTHAHTHTHTHIHTHAHTHTHAHAHTHAHTHSTHTKPKLCHQCQYAFIGITQVFCGVIMIKFLGVIVLLFAKTQLIEIYYFRMYMYMVVVGALHGLVLLPVILSYVGELAHTHTHTHTHSHTYTNTCTHTHL